MQVFACGAIDLLSQDTLDNRHAMRPESKGHVPNGIVEGNVEGPSKIDLILWDVVSLHHSQFSAVSAK